MGERADVGLLEGILGLGIVAKDAARNAIKAPVVAAHKGADRAFVAGDGECDQGRLIGRQRRGGAAKMGGIARHLPIRWSAARKVPAIEPASPPRGGRGAPALLDRERCLEPGELGQLAETPDDARTAERG